jgi:hypothetical protein
MNRSNLENQIANAHLYNDKEKITAIYYDLINLKAKLDRWFNKYLDMFDEKMNSSTRSDPVWKLYHAKSEEYSDVVQIIKTAEYFLRKA